MDALLLASPDAAIAAIPHLLGFTPTSSLVLAWSREDHLILTQRMDLADETSPQWADEAVRHGIGLGAQAVIAVAFRPRGEHSELPGRRTMNALERRLASAGVELVDALIVDERLWWSYRCNQPCCPPSGRTLDDEVAAEVVAEFVLNGSAPFATRDALEASLQRDPIMTIRAEPRVEGADLEAWRTSVLGGPVCRLLAGEELSDDDSSILLGALVDIRVRDTFLWCLTGAHVDPRSSLGSLSLLLRRAPDGFVAPIATLTAIAAWVCGDGARASIAVAQALLEDEGYSLALLVDRSLRVGLPPSEWLASMRTLTHDQCRFGT